MIKAQIDYDEEQRLEAIQRYVPVAAALPLSLGRILDMAVRLFQIPMASVTFVERNQVWELTSGDLNMHCLARAGSLCDTVVRQGVVLVVPDSYQDPRFAKSPSVIGPPYLRFYAGAPLRSSDGFLIGTLCLLDSRPRPRLSQQQQETLRDLATLVVDVLDLQIARTETLAAERARRQSESLLASVYESAPVGLCVLDEQGDIVQVNRGFCELCSYTPKEVIGTPFLSVVPKELREEYWDYFGRFMAAPGRFAHELQLRCKDGSIIDVMITSNGVAPHDGRRLAVFSISDISERKRVEQELIATREAALQASHLKSAFLANMSHEIRTPMNGVIGMLDLLLNTSLQPDQQDYAETARNSGVALLSLLNDILDLSKIEAGKLSIQTTSFDLQALIEDVVSLFVEQAVTQGLWLDYEMPADLPPRLVGDPVRLRQVLINLVGNAVKFTPAGSVIVRVDWSLDNRSALSSELPEGVRAKVTFRVVDTGIGISTADQMRLFQSFIQIDSSSTRRYSGTGLGLAISRQLVELMGGTLTVVSAPGAGSTFSFTLPLNLEPSYLALSLDDETMPFVLNDPDIPRHPGRGRILVVEDNPLNQKVTLSLLELMGYETRLATNGLVALRILEQESFALIFMDIQMPELDGIATTIEIRRRQQDRHTPIVALTAHALQGERDRCLSAGMDDYVSKPVTQNALASVLHRWLTGVESQPQAPAPVPLSDSPLDLNLIDQLRFLHQEGQPSVLDEVITLFVEDTPPRLAALRQAIIGANVPLVRELAHGLKGSCSNLGAVRMIGLCRQIEELARNEQLNQAIEVMQQLEAEFECVRVALEIERQRS